VINRSPTKEIPHSRVALHEVPHLLGTVVAEIVLASVHRRAHEQVGHTDLGDLSKTTKKKPCEEGGRFYMGKASKVNAVNTYRLLERLAKVVGSPSRNGCNRQHPVIRTAFVAAVHPFAACSGGV
jgi:hypothetical protein